MDSTCNEQTADNAERFATFPATSRLFLPGGKPPAVGSVFRNRDLARTNRIQGGKRPRSSMAPTIVLRKGKPLVVLGWPAAARPEPARRERRREPAAA